MESSALNSNAVFPRRKSQRLLRLPTKANIINFGVNTSKQRQLCLL